MIVAGSIVGSGELIATTKTGAEAGFTLLWLILIGCVVKVFVQVELGRRAVITGETLSPHNTFMKVAVEGGWSAMVGYGILLLGMLYKCRSVLASSFVIAMSLRALFESSTPFTLSLVSAMLIVPFFLNEVTMANTAAAERVPVE